jgi:phosphatidylserine/phosphatidylglycerophosphate/cardiolipin synthase-like enzyme
MSTRLMPRSLKFLLPLMLTVLLMANGPEAHARKRQSKQEKMLESAERMMTEALAKPPGDLEVCFSPVELCDVKLVKFIKTATKSIDVAIYDINLDQVVHELLVASKKIPVRIIADRRQAKGDHSLVPLLIKAGAQVRFGRQRGVMHNKFTIVDGKMIELGSFNYTNNASKNNNENQLYIANPSVVERYQKRFNEMWADAFPPKGEGQ